MDKEDFNSYLKNRYEKEMNWYDKKAKENKIIYVILQITVIVLSAITPILIGLPVSTSGININSIAIIISLIVTITSSILITFKFHENWINYRTSCETLRKERYYYKAKLYDYDNIDDPEGLFVSRVENVISREHTLWLTIEKKKSKKRS